jgi:hypothetical protein
MLKIPLDIPIRIHDLLYKQIETTDVNVGDLVLDLGDFTFGYVDMRKGDKIAVRDGCVTELGVPISRVRKLALIPDNKS